MSWSDALANWPALIKHLCEDFRYLEEAALRRFRGDREKMLVYLAETHDLTLSEAEETLTDWFDRIARRVQHTVAA